MPDPADPHPSAPVPGDDIPLAKPASAPASPPSPIPGQRPIFEVEEDRCPKCGELMTATAVVCLKCGYDLRGNVVREIETGTVEPPPTIEEREAAGLNDFVVPGRLTAKTLTITGGIFTLAAMAAAGVWGAGGAGGGTQRSFLLVLGWVLYTLYTIALNTATGIAAVAVAAKINQQPFGRLDAAAARMFAAFALFQAVTNIRPPLGYAVFTAGLPYLIGAALYFGAIMILFKKDRQTATLIAVAHFLLWMLLQLGPVLAGWISVAATAAPKPV